MDLISTRQVSPASGIRPVFTYLTASFASRSWTLSCARDQRASMHLDAYLFQTGVVSTRRSDTSRPWLMINKRSSSQRYLLEVARILRFELCWRARRKHRLICELSSFVSISGWPARRFDGERYSSTRKYSSSLLLSGVSAYQIAWMHQHLLFLSYIPFGQRLFCIGDITSNDWTSESINATQQMTT